jgi:hypothetical protein
MLIALACQAALSAAICMLLFCQRVTIVFVAAYSIQ